MNTPRGTVAGWWDCARDAAWDGTYDGTSWDRTFEAREVSGVEDTNMPSAGESRKPRIPLPRSAESDAQPETHRPFFARLARARRS